MPHNTFLVIPTIRNLDFLSEWGRAFQDVTILVVEDHPAIQIQTPTFPCRKIYHYTWKDISDDFGKDEWVFSRKNAGIRSYGFWKASQLGAKTIITLDDDCFPADDSFVKKHEDNLEQKAPDGWFATYPDHRFMFTRGVPYDIRGKHQAVISHGLWTNKIDLDGQTEILHENLTFPLYPSVRQYVPFGLFFPMCSMNLAFSSDITVLMYFPLMGCDPSGKSWGFDRFDDIWAGIFAKKICDHFKLAVVNGSPFIEHRRMSDPHANVTKEKAGIAVNELLWKSVNDVHITKQTPATAYKELAEKIVFPNTSYFISLRKAMIIWSMLFI